MELNDISQFLNSIKDLPKSNYNQKKSEFLIEYANLQKNIVVYKNLLELETELFALLYKKHPSSIDIFKKSLHHFVCSDLFNTKIDLKKLNTIHDLSKYSKIIFQYYNELNKHIILENAKNCKNKLFNCLEAIDSNKINISNEQYIYQCKMLKKTFDIINDQYC
tara:strand:+ start:12086 stop:12577 length:492 start_codon:yes stop_codon:yes gene_type:complete